MRGRGAEGRVSAGLALVGLRWEVGREDSGAEGRGVAFCSISRLTDLKSFYGGVEERAQVDRKLKVGPCTNWWWALMFDLQRAKGSRVLTTCEY